MDEQHDGVALIGTWSRRTTEVRMSFTVPYIV